MEYMDEILKNIKSRFPNLKNISNYKLINNIFCISCDIDQSSIYYVLYPKGKVQYKGKGPKYEYDNQHDKHVGNGIVFIDLNYEEQIKAFLYIDDVGMDWPVEITYANDKYIVTEHEERTHIIYLDDFSVTSFGGITYKIYDPFILIFPYWGYSTYDTFAILDVISKTRIDLRHKLKTIIKNDLNLSIEKQRTGYDFGWFLEQAVSINESHDYLLYKDYSNEVFKIPIDDIFKNTDDLENFKKELNSEEFHNQLQVINGPWSHGVSLDCHTIKSTFNQDGSFSTERTKIGDLLYQIKYKFKKELIPELVEIILDSINNYFNKKIDIIIPVPPSNLNRPFQPLEAIAIALAKELNIAIDTNYLIKVKVTPPIKQFENNVDRQALLKNVHAVSGKQYRGKTILLFDDLYRSGETLNAATKILKDQGEVAEVFVLTITKTRTKK
jgi:competence protein ComFC